MRTLTTTARTELTKDYGLEPFFMVEITWAPGNTVQYSTKALLGLTANLLSIGEIQQSLTFDNFEVTTTSITIDDTDGAIKAVVDAHDIHKCRCVVYLLTTGMALSDKVTLLVGTISTPYTWSEGERQVTFSVTSEIEHFEVGFSPEEGQLPWITEEAVGKAWPLVFGNVLHVPAVKLKQIEHAKLLDLFTIPDPILYHKRQQLANAYNQCLTFFTYYNQLHLGIHNYGLSSVGLLADYIDILNAEDYLQLQMLSLQADQNIDRNAIGVNPVGLVERQAFRDRNNITLPNLTAALAQVAMEKKQAEDDIKRLAQLYELDKKTITQIANEYDNMRVIWEQYRQVQEEICIQESTFKPTVRVEGESIYADDAEICIKKTRFAVSFNKTDHTMTFVDGPIDQFVNTAVEPWTPDDEVCSGIAAMDGVNMFRLAVEYEPGTTNVIPPPDLTGMFLLVRKVGETDSFQITLTGSTGYVRFKHNGFSAPSDLTPLYGSLYDVDIQAHLDSVPGLNGKFTVSGGQGGPWKIEMVDPDETLIIPEFDKSGDSECEIKQAVKRRHLLQVERQDGYKVYFKLCPWLQDNTESGHGWSISKIVNKIVSSIWPTDQALGTAPGAFPAQYDPSIWLQPQSQTLLDALAQIPAGVNKDELKNLAELCFLQAFDGLAGTFIYQPTTRDIYTIIGEDVAIIKAASGTIPRSWYETYAVWAEEVPEKMGFVAPPQTEIVDCDDHCEIFCANILPSDVVAVHAYRKTETGDDVLESVPSDYYVLDEAKNMGTYTMTMVTVKRALYMVPGENWSDTLYVSLKSSIGPNVVDILEWLITTYTDKTADSTTFAAVKATIGDKYPANFALFSRPNVLSELKRIAFEARMAIILRGDTFYLYYLSEEPTSQGTWTDADIVTKTQAIEHTATEEIVTRLVAQYQKSYLPLRLHELPPKHVLRWHIDKYGLHERTEQWHIYNDGDLVYKSAAFWLIRWANTWKRQTLEVFWLDKIEYEVLDAIEVNGQLMLIHSITYSPIDHKLIMTLDTPIRSGETTQYPFYWPALETPADIGDGFGSGYGPGSGVTGTVTDCVQRVSP